MSRDPADVLAEQKRRRTARRSSAHDCARCAEWREVLAAHREGRRDEAAIEACRLMHNGADHGCALAAHVVGVLRNDGFLEELR